MVKRIIYLFAFLSLLVAGPSLAQQTPQSDPELTELIRRARLSMSEYKTRFKDLTAEEEQTIEEYDSQGKLEKQRRISSDLVVYQSQVNPAEMFEYRDVKAVDGVAVKKREARLVNILNKSSKADSVKKEFDRISRESRRYDLGNSFYGMTLNQGMSLEENVRDAFQFTLAGREQIGGRDVTVIDYQQVSQSPSLTFDLKALPGPLKGATGFFRGRLWLDAETAQIRKEVREFTLRLPSQGDPLVMHRFELEYAESRFGFLTPQRIVINNFTRGRTGADKKPELLLGGKITFAYGAFTRFAVDTPDAAITPPPKP
jgi:Sec-independent protein translocase protein TatA